MQLLGVNRKSINKETCEGLYQIYGGFSVLLKNYVIKHNFNIY